MSDLRRPSLWLVVLLVSWLMQHWCLHPSLVSFYRRISTSELSSSPSGPCVTGLPSSPLTKPSGHDQCTPTTIKGGWTFVSLSCSNLMATLPASTLIMAWGPRRRWQRQRPWLEAPTLISFCHGWSSEAGLATFWCHNRIRSGIL